MLLLLQSAVTSGWVGPTMAISLLVIALSFVAIAAALALALLRAAKELQQLARAIDSLRDDLSPALKAVKKVSDEGERLAQLVSGETEELVQTSRALREGIRERLVNMEAVYDVLAEEIEETALEAAVTLKSFRTGVGWFGLVRRLLRLGRRR
jgi:uncharacterized protein YoxC